MKPNPRGLTCTQGSRSDMCIHTLRCCLLCRSSAESPGSSDAARMLSKASSRTGAASRLALRAQLYFWRSVGV